jgi:hypothetical protein
MAVLIFALLTMAQPLGHGGMRWIFNGTAIGIQDPNARRQGDSDRPVYFE